MSELFLIIIFVVSGLLGYRVIRTVPSLLHTPLMSGMNALSGITVVGALAATAAAHTTGSRILGFIALVMAAVNVVAGFVVTNRMLRMFRPEQGGGDR